MSLINKEQAIADCLKFFPECSNVVDMVLQKEPEVDAKPVVHAHWDPDPVYFGAGADMLNGIGNDDNVLAHYKCSRCGRRISHLKEKRLGVEYPYCHCGAAMDEEVEG